jgi:hypothetical protein
MTLEPIAYIEFTAGVIRPVFEDTRGQFVFDDDGHEHCEHVQFPLAQGVPGILATTR